MTPAFKTVMKNSSRKNPHKELLEIQKKVNFCSNATIKKYLRLIEDLSRKFKHGSSFFSWKRCFDLEESNGFCPDKMKLALGQLPEEKDALVEALNGEHFVRLKPGKIMISVLSIFGHAIDPEFDSKILQQYYNLELVNLERLGQGECNRQFYEGK